MDVKNDFLHREWDQEIYLNQLKRFENGVEVISRYMQNSKKPNLNATVDSTDLAICQS